MMAGFMIAGPNEALIKSGGKGLPKVVVGGRAFVIPIIQKAQRLSLEVMTLTVETSKVYTSEGVAVSVDGVAQVKVARGEDAIRTAAQQFLGRRREEIAQVALQTMEGHQRAILGTMSVEEIYQDREGFGLKVREVASPDMANMGLEIVSFTIRDIQDEHGYLDALGVRRTAEVRRDADIGQAEATRDSDIKKAEADRDAGIRSAGADRDKQAARFEADTKIAESQRDFSVEKAAYDREVNARQAEADLAAQLQEAKTRQQIREEELEVEVIERKKQIEVEQQEITRRERELDATVRRPAEAERFRLETVAVGEKAKTVAEAEAEAEALTLRGEGESNAIRLKGEAEADAIRAQGMAEAEAMRKKAAAWKEYGQAAVIDRLITSLPEVASAVAEPLSKTDRIVMISGGGDGQSVGPSRLTGDITKVVAQVPEVIEALTGIDILGTLKNLSAVVTTDSSNGDAAPTDVSSGEATAEEEPSGEASDGPSEETSKESGD